MDLNLKSWVTVLAAASLSAGYANAAPTAAEAPMAAAAQPVGTCFGTVVDELGEPLAGATVKLVGTNKIVATDIDGHFTFSDVNTGAKLQISYIGYDPIEATWTGSDLNLNLKPAVGALDEVVVVGYGLQKKVNVTGSVSMVGDEVFASRPVANAQQALQGAIPGLNLSTTDAGGELNASMAMNIRGTGTIGDGSVANPLVLIDGIEGSINSLNPNDIESVSVLKDAAASSIYGARAAFGVILVTTKNGKGSEGGKVRVQYSGDVRFSTATQVPNMASNIEWATYFNAAQYNENGGYVFSDETLDLMRRRNAGEFTDPTDPRYYGVNGVNGAGMWNNYGSAFANTDWFAEHYKKNVPSTQHNISLSGGNTKINWLISGSYLLNQGLIRHGHDEMNRYTTNAKIGVELAKWARVDFNTKWTRTDYERPTYMTGLFFHNIARRWPTCPVIDPNGHYMNEMEIVELEELGIHGEKSDLFTQQARFTFTPLKGWNIVADGAVRITNSRTTETVDPIYYYKADNTPILRNSDWGTRSYITQNRSTTNYYAVNVFTDYTRSWGEHNGKVLVGMNYEKWDVNGLYGRGYDLINSDYPFISQTQNDFEASDSYWHRSTAGYFARLNYDYAGRYLFEANIRYDGSSRFLSDRRWAWFPSFSLGWNIAKEAFMEPIAHDLSTLKVRASWGKLGNTSSAYSSFWDWYPFYQQQGTGTNNSGWLINGAQGNTASLPAIVNSSMTWEKVATWDAGLDVAALNNRLTGSFDWFQRTTDDMIGPAPVLGSVLGTNAPKTNNCSMRTRGWELEIGWNDRIGKVNYNARVNLSDSWSEITEYPYDGDFGAQSVGNYYNGRKVGEIWGFRSEGIAQSQEQMDEWLKDNKPSWGSNWGAGDIMYRDLNGDGKVDQGAYTLDDHGDWVIIGNNTPRYRIGINLGVEWKGIDFSAFFQGVCKRDYSFASQPYFWGGGGGMWQSTVFKEHLDYWTPENPDAYYPRPYFGTGKNRQTQDRYLQDASYLRCKNMQLGYSLPANIISHAGMSNVRVYVSVDNLFTITKMSNVFDPEALGGSWGAGKIYPLQRTWSVGLNIGF